MEVKHPAKPPGKQSPAEPGKWAEQERKRGLRRGMPPRSRETLHHGRLPEGNGATGKPPYFPPHP